VPEQLRKLERLVLREFGTVAERENHVRHRGARLTRSRPDPTGTTGVLSGRSEDDGASGVGDDCWPIGRAHSAGRADG
jgi:hypothetical protein